MEKTDTQIFTLLSYGCAFKAVCCTFFIHKSRQIKLSHLGFKLLKTAYTSSAFVTISVFAPTIYGPLTITTILSSEKYFAKLTRTKVVSVFLFCFVFVFLCTMIDLWVQFESNLSLKRLLPLMSSVTGGGNFRLQLFLAV